MEIAGFKSRRGRSLGYAKMDVAAAADVLDPINIGWRESCSMVTDRAAFGTGENRLVARGRPQPRSRL